MRLGGLGARLAIGFAVVGVLTALVVGSASYLTTDRQVTREIDDFLEKRAEEIADGRRDEPRERRDRDSDEPIIVSVSPDAEVQVLDATGVVMSNTGLLLPVDDVDLERVADDRRPVIRTVVIGGAEFRMITQHLDGGGAVQVARSFEESASLLDVIRTRTLATAGLVAVLAALAGWAYAQRTTRPLRALTGAVDEVAQTRDFSVTVPAGGRDEVGRLADGFNRMLAALQRSQHQQRQLVQDAAHELRTPLTSVTANVDWLMRASDLGPQERNETLAGVRRELTELNTVMSEIIELATDSHRATAAGPVDLVAVVEAAVDRFVQRSGRQVTVDTSGSSGSSGSTASSASSATVIGDADGLDRALGNLLANADKYSPAGSPIAVLVEAHSPDGRVGVFVDDAGPGIPFDERGRVFDRFYRRDQDRSMPGSGLGLSIVAGIVEQHDGEVVVEESPLGGARVGFRLPTTP